MISNELRVRIFGAYLFNHFRYDDFFDESHISAAIGWGCIDNTKGVRFILDRCKLILRPLNLLTDEHAMTIAHLAGWRLGELSDSGESIDVSVDKFSRTSIDLHKMVVKEYIYSTGHTLESPLESTLKIIDFLRKNGYDVGYGDIESLIQAGVAISSDTPLSTQSHANDSHTHPDIIGEAIIEPEEV